MSKICNACLLHIWEPGMVPTAVDTIISSAAAYAACQLWCGYCSAHTGKMAKSMLLMTAESVRVQDCSENYAKCIRTMTRRIFVKTKYTRRQIFVCLEEIIIAAVDTAP